MVIHRVPLRGNFPMDAVVAIDHRAEAERAEALWRRWKNHHDVAARNRLVLSYAPMVKYLATRKVRDLPAHCELDDLVSAGLIALISAVDRFDPTKGASFEQYVWTRITGSIQDELRRQDWAPRSLRRTSRLIEQTRDEWWSKHGQAPSDEDVAQKLEVTVAELHGHANNLERASVLSLNVPARGGEGLNFDEIGDLVEDSAESLDPERSVLSNDRSAAMKEAISSLSVREQRILALAINEELQNSEIARILGISQSRISQLMSGIRQKLAIHMAAYESGRSAWSPR